MSTITNCFSTIYLSAAREQLIREKERRARLQYERTVEERWRRLEEQRQKEELRRAAVEEKRRQQLEEERERLEALMRRSLERSLQLEQRTKRWNRGCPSGAGRNRPKHFVCIIESVNFSWKPHTLPRGKPLIQKNNPSHVFLYCTGYDKHVVCHHAAPCSPHRSPLCGALNSSDHSRLQGGSQSTPNTPKARSFRLRSERRNASPGYGSPVRRSESPASVNKHLSSPTCFPIINVLFLFIWVVLHECLYLCSIESAPGSTGKLAAGTTNAEEATKLLAERRRQARAQKELEEKKREEEEDRLQLWKEIAEEQRQQEAKAQQMKEERKKEEDIQVKKKEEEKQKAKDQEKELQAQNEKEVRGQFTSVVITAVLYEIYVRFYCYINCILHVFIFSFESFFYFIHINTSRLSNTEDLDNNYSLLYFSPASKEELISIPEFSPIIESQLSSMSNTRALEDLMDLTGSVSYPKLSSENNIGDCNRNLIEGVVSPMSDSKLIGVSSPSSNKLTIK
uniref:MAP7 domain containing 2a n=1 Tax=Sphaeramia orbicularis TaxID=375764 RepID=A0A672ZS63_9TELE